jgi:hypothetical protein
MFIPVLFIIAQKWKETDLRNKMWNIYTKDHYSAIKGNNLWVYVTK